MGGLCAVQSTPRLANNYRSLTANGTTNIFSHKHFNVVLSNFSPCPVQLSGNPVVGQASKAAERILTVNASKVHFTQRKEGRETVQNFDSIDEDSSTRSQNDEDKMSTTAAEPSP